MDKFRELKAAAMAATPGPWSYNGNCKFGIWWPTENCYVLSANTHEDAAFIAAANPAVILALLAELEAKDERIGELERANTSQDDHINQQQDRIESLEKTNTGLGQRLGAAEKRLATPVRLPKPCAFNLCDLVDRDAVIASLREQGFTVEGDE